jgi:hypothetical protein
MRAIRSRGIATHFFMALVVAAGACWTSRALAQEPTPDAANGAAPPAPIGLSGGLSNSFVLRGNGAESTLMTVLSASYAWTSSFSTFARVGSVYNASTGLESAAGWANPALGASVLFPVTKSLSIGGLSGVTIPVGSGGGNSPSPAALRAWTNSIDWGGAMFAVNHVDIFAGVHAQYSLDRLTLQFDSTLHELLRVRGQETDPIGAAATVTGTTATVSYAVLPQLSFSTALSETRVWNTPTYVVVDPNSRVDYFFSAGVSTDVKIGRTDVTPGLVYARALDLPLSGQGFQVAELDLGFSL